MNVRFGAFLPQYWEEKPQLEQIEQIPVSAGNRFFFKVIEGEKHEGV